MSIYEFLEKEPFLSNGQRQTCRAYDIHQYEHYQVHKSQLFRGKRVIAMNYKKGNSHCKHHWYHSQTIEKTYNECHGACQFTEDSQLKRQRVAYTNGSGKTADSS